MSGLGNWIAKTIMYWQPGDKLKCEVEHKLGGPILGEIVSIESEDKTGYIYLVGHHNTWLGSRIAYPKCYFLKTYDADTGNVMEHERKMLQTMKDIFRPIDEGEDWKEE